MKIIRQTNLWCYDTVKNHDKVYNVYLSEDNGNYQVYVQYGRRGASFQHHEKMRTCAEWAAQDCFNDWVRAKTSKGYKVTDKLTYVQEDLNALSGYYGFNFI